MALHSPKLHKFLLVAFCIEAVVFAALGGFLYFRRRFPILSESLYRPLSKVQSSSPTPTPTPSPSPQPGYTVLLMGKAGAGHEGGGLTDTMLVARILDETKQILLLSIPRDLWVALQQGANVTYGKINSAYPLGRGQLAVALVSQVTGLNIDNYIALDFSGFEQAIDIVGGVDINVPSSFTDPEYPIAGRESLDCATYTGASSIALPSADGLAPQEYQTISIADLITRDGFDTASLSGLPKQYPCRYELLHFDAGLQHMNGTLALKYVRSRHSPTSGSDFARTQRQRQVIDAVVSKLFTTGQISKIPSFFATLRSHLDTDLNAGNFLSLLPRATQLSSYQVTEASLTTENYLRLTKADHSDALVPLAGDFDYTPIRNWISSLITPGVSLEYPVIEVDSKEKLATDAAILVDLNHFGFAAHASRTTTATTAATLYVQNPKLETKIIEQVRVTAGISPQFVKVVKSVAGSPIDLKILLPTITVPAKTL